MGEHPREPALHTLNPTGRFSDRAEDYARARPSYAPGAIDAVLDGKGEASGLTAADVGAGTGISSRLLAERGVRVFAIEPNEAMRAAAIAHPRVEWRPATAEATGLDDSSVDLVLSAQAFHWFDPERALAEFRRILGPSGRLALMWNDKDQRDPLTAEYTRLVAAAANGHPALSEHRWPDAVFGSARIRNVRERAFPYAQRLDRQGLVLRAISASYVPKSGADAEALVRGLHGAFERFRDESGAVWMRYTTRVFLAEPA